MSIFRHLPKDLVEEEIVSRIPCRHLRRLRSTCKRWNRLFYNPGFAKKHTEKASKEHLVLMLTKGFRLYPVSINLDGIVPSVEVKNELSLIDPNSGSQFNISEVFHCEGLLLCGTEENKSARLVVWNPCTGQTKWIKAVYFEFFSFTNVLGYHQDNSKSSGKNYKVLRFCPLIYYSEIYEFSTGSWKVLDHDLTPPGWDFFRSDICVSLKGKTYWFVYDKTKTHPSIYLLSFDFSSERSSLLVRLPSHCSKFVVMRLSAVREEKLCVLLQSTYSSKIEIWVTNKIDETTPVSWSKVLAFDRSPDYPLSMEMTFLLDEEKKVALCCEMSDHEEDDMMHIDNLYSVGEDNKTVTPVYSRSVSIESPMPAIVNYVPSLVHIQPVGGSKTKRGL